MSSGRLFYHTGRSRNGTPFHMLWWVYGLKLEAPIWVRIGHSGCHTYLFYMPIKSLHFYYDNALLLGSLEERNYGVFLVLVLLFDLDFAWLKTDPTTIMLHLKTHSFGYLNETEGMYYFEVMDLMVPELAVPKGSPFSFLPIFYFAWGF